MKRILAVVLAILMICPALLPAYADDTLKFSLEFYYEEGLKALKLLSTRDAESAVSYFKAAGSNYKFAVYYEVYAETLLEILRWDENGGPDPDTLKTDLRDLQKKTDFVGSLEEEGLYSCAQLLAYIDARTLEDSGDHAAAWHLYASIETVLDSFQRKRDLREKAYLQGKAAFDKGEFRLAADALMDLDYKDSEELLLSCNEKLEPTPEPQPTQTPAPKPSPSSAPTQEPSPAPDPESIVPTSWCHFEEEWNSQEGKMDVYCNGYLLPSDPYELIKTIGDSLGLEIIKSGDIYRLDLGGEILYGFADFRGVKFDTIETTDKGNSMCLSTIFDPDNEADLWSHLESFAVLYCMMAESYPKEDSYYYILDENTGEFYEYPLSYEELSLSSDDLPALFTLNFLIGRDMITIFMDLSLGSMELWIRLDDK